MRSACASTFAVVTPTRSPVNMPGPDADRDRRQLVDATPLRSQHHSIAGASVSACRGGPRRRGAAQLDATRACPARSRAPRRRGASRCRSRAAALTRPRLPRARRRAAVAAVAQRRAVRVELDRARVRRRRRRVRGARPNRSGGSTGAIGSPHSTSVTRLVEQLLEAESCSSCIRSSRYTSTCATGTRPSYSCTIVNVGLVTGLGRRRARGPGPWRTSSCPRRDRRRARRRRRRAAATPTAPRQPCRCVGRRCRDLHRDARQRALDAHEVGARPRPASCPPLRSTADGCSVGMSIAVVTGALERELLARAAS